MKILNYFFHEKSGDEKITGKIQFCLKDTEMSKIKNSSNRLYIETPRSGKCQQCHPKVLYFEERFGGHHFWMTYTPYPYGEDSKENPCIVYSDDMINWKKPNGVRNPLDKGNAKNYMSDPHLVYNDDTKLLEIWYRQALTSLKTEVIYRKTSPDGVNWSKREEMYRFTGTEDGYAGFSHILSPCIIYENHMYKIWAGSGNPKGYLKYYETPDGFDWNLKATTNLEGWHYDIIKTDIGYECFISDEVTGKTVSYSKSSDGIDWDDKKVIIESPNKNSWDSDKLYRTTAIKIDKKYYLFYTGVRNSVWGIGLTISTKENDITSLRGYVDGDIVTYIDNNEN